MTQAGWLAGLLVCSGLEGDSWEVTLFAPPSTKQACMPPPSRTVSPSEQAIRHKQPPRIKQRGKRGVLDKGNSGDSSTSSGARGCKIIESSSHSQAGLEGMARLEGVWCTSTTQHQERKNSRVDHTASLVPTPAERTGS